MKGFFKTIQKDTVLLWSFWATIVLVVSMVAAIGISFTNLPPFLPLYNHMPWGYARLGNTYEIFLLPASIVLLCCINTSIGIGLMEKSPLLTRFLFLTMVTLAFFTAIFIGKLIFITL